MSAFEHVTALWSFVYALALTHLLARIAELIVARVTACVFPGCSRWAWLMPFSWSSPTGVALGSSFDQELGSCFCHHPAPGCHFSLPDLRIGRAQGSRRRRNRSGRFFLAPAALFLWRSPRHSHSVIDRESRFSEDTECRVIR